MIFVAVDFSPASDVALRQAHTRAKASGAELVVCHVMPDSSRSNMLFPQASAGQNTERLELTERVAAGLVERTCEVTGRAASEFRIFVDAGVPYACVVARAEELGAELVVVGDRGTSGITRMLLGSVADRVIRYAHCPVLVARDAPATGSVVVGTDLSDPSLPAIAAAARESLRPGVRVFAVHAIDLAISWAGPGYGAAWSSGVPVDVIEQAHKRADASLAGALEQHGLAAEQEIVDGAPASAILAVASRVHAELVILGTRGNTGLRRVLLGSVAESVARHAECSVLVVRHMEPARG